MQLTPYYGFSFELAAYLLQSLGKSNKARHSRTYFKAGFRGIYSNQL